MSVKEKVLALCSERGIKPGTLEKKTGISNATIRRWTDETTSTGETLIKLADFFEVSVDYLLGREEKTEKILSSDEKELLEIYSSVSIEGKAAIITAARAFAGQVDYTKKESASVTA